MVKKLAMVWHVLLAFIACKRMNWNSIFECIKAVTLSSFAGHDHQTPTIHLSTVSTTPTTTTVVQKSITASGTISNSSDIPTYHINQTTTIMLSSTGSPDDTRANDSDGGKCTLWWLTSCHHTITGGATVIILSVLIPLLIVIVSAIAVMFIVHCKWNMLLLIIQHSVTDHGGFTLKYHSLYSSLAVLVVHSQARRC